MIIHLNLIWLNTVKGEESLFKGTSDQVRGSHGSTGPTLYNLQLIGRNLGTKLLVTLWESKALGSRENPSLCILNVSELLSVELHGRNMHQEPLTTWVSLWVELELSSKCLSWHGDFKFESTVNCPSFVFHPWSCGIVSYSIFTRTCPAPFYTVVLHNVIFALSLAGLV